MEDCKGYCKRNSLLVVEELGVERSTEYAMEQVFTVIDSRYRSKKPLIVTTNLKLEEIKNPPDLADPRIYDCILERFVETLLNRSMRLDILATDGTGTKLNVEVQRSDKGAGRKRARYNSSMMDATLLKKGEDCDKLPETWVIFITENDVMGKISLLSVVILLFSLTACGSRDTEGQAVQSEQTESQTIEGVSPIPETAKGENTVQDDIDAMTSASVKAPGNVAER